MRNRTGLLPAILCSVIMSAGIWLAGSAIGATMAHASTSARSVSLADASMPPSELAYLYPSARVTYAAEIDAYNCPLVNGWFTDVSAYHWNGSALGPQRWNRDRTVTYWRARSGRVTFDGITFRNHTRERVLVAGWC